MRKTIVNIAFLLCVFYASAQTKILKGKVIDVDNKEPLAFVNVVSADNPSVGISTDTLGYFNLEVPATTNRLTISFIGYETLEITYSKGQNREAKIIELTPLVNEMDEISVRPGKNPAHVLLGLIRDNRKKNDPDNIDPLDVMVYNHTTVAMENLDKEAMQSKVLLGLDKSLIKLDDTTMLMPMVVSEELLNIKRDFNNKINQQQQVSHSNNGLSFFNSPDMMAFVAPITDRVNFYQNYIHIMNRDFASPLAFNAPINYRMFITDTALVNNKTQYKIVFESRHEKDLAFNGYFWVESGTYAVTEIYADLNQHANVNLVKKLRVHNVFEPYNDSLWFYKKQDVQISFKYQLSDDTTQKKVTMVASKLAGYHSKDEMPEELTSIPVRNNLYTPSRAQREDMLNHYRNIEPDTMFSRMNYSLWAMKQNPFIHQVEKLLDMGLKGYYKAGIIDVGPFLDIYRKNAIEGDRFSLPLRTSEQFAENFSIGGYYGYGLRDKKSKYGANLYIKHPATLYDVVGLQYWNDVTIVGHNDHLSLVKENSYTYGEDNLISAMFQINENTNMSAKRQFAAFWEHDWTRGITQKIKYENNRVYEQSEFVPFTSGENSIPFIDYQEISLNTRFSFNEDYYDAYFHRLYFGNRYPVINLKLAAGRYYTGLEANNYYSVHMAYKHKLIFGSVFLRYMVEAGHIFGEVPFPLLELHRGNETYGYARYYFNLLQNMEYASDTYATLHSTLYLNGLILNKVPLIKHLEMREVVSFKAIAGTLTQDHQSIMDYPETLGPVQSPYAEVGVGITNLFKILRIEYVMRLTDTDKEGVLKDGVRFRIEFTF